MSGSSGVFTSVVPTCELAGQPGAPPLEVSNCASEHACAPSATAGLRTTPGGSDTSARLTLDCARPAPGSGWVSATVTPAGVSRAGGVSETSSDGVNGTPPQSVGSNDEVFVSEPPW